MMNPYWATQSGQLENLYERGWYPHKFMGPWMMGGYGQETFWIFALLCIVTWVLIIVALIAFIRWMWKKGDKV